MLLLFYSILIITNQIFDSIMKISCFKSFIYKLFFSFLTFCLFLSYQVEVKASPQNNTCPQNMVFISGGIFKIGSDSHYPSELSAEDIKVDSFCIDKYEVTNGEFAKFVQKTGYITVAERPLSKTQFPNLPDEKRKPGSLVFQIPSQSMPIGYLSWWKWTPGANWQHPFERRVIFRVKINIPSFMSLMKMWKLMLNG